MDRPPFFQDIPGLAEKVAAARRRDKRQQRRYLIAIVIGALLVGGALVFAVSELGRNAPPPVTIDAAKLPPITPGAR